jgi:hypothetical protein
MLTSATPTHVSSTPTLGAASTSILHKHAFPANMESEPQSLRGLFSRAERTREELSSSYEPNSPTYQENLRATIATYEECLKIAEQVSLFSPNETLEDISSSDLQYAPHIWFLRISQ